MSREIFGQTVFYRQQPCIDVLNKEHHNFMIGFGYLKQDGSESKMYTSFPSENDYEKWALNLPEKTCYEIVQPDSTINEYYDIDDWEDKSISPKDMAELWFLARTEFGQYLYKNNEYNRGDMDSRPVLRENIIIMDASKFNDGKMVKGSLHVRNFGMTFFNSKDLKQFQLAFKDFIDTNKTYSKLKWDPSVYSKYRNIRMEGNTKCGQNRPLLRTNWFPCNKPSYITCNVNNAFMFNPFTLGYDDEIEKVEIKQEVPVEIKDKDDIVAQIVAKIKDGEHPFCDVETGLLTYANAIKFWFTIRDYKGTKYLIDNWNEIYTVYRHCNESSKQGQLVSILNSESSNDNTNILFWGKCIPSFINNNKDTFNLIFDQKKTAIVKGLYKQIIDSVKHTDRYVDSSLYEDEENKGIIISSGLGSGKSFSIVNHINKVRYDSILVLTPRRSYAKSAFFRFKSTTTYDWVCYMDRKGDINSEYTIVQMESLHRVQPNYDLVIIDESESFLTQLTSRDTNGDNHICNIQTLERIIKNCSKVILLDAFVSYRSKSFLLNLGIKNIITHEYTEIYNGRNATKISIINPKTNKQNNQASLEAFVSSIIQDIKAKKKLFVFSSSQSALNNKIIPTLLTKLPNLKYMLYYAKYATKPLCDVEEEWKDVDIVFTTSTITVGIDFNTKDVFHKVYMYISANSRNLVRDCFQASFRIRHPIDNELVYFVDDRVFVYNLGLKKKDSKMRVDSICKLFEGKDHVMPLWLRKIYIDNEHERNISIKGINQCVDYFLNKCGYTKKIVDSGFKHINMAENKQLPPYHSIATIDTQLADNLRSKNTLTETELLTLSKYEMNRILDLNGEIDKNSIEFFALWNNWNKQRHKFSNLMWEKRGTPPTTQFGAYEDLNIKLVKYNYIKQITSMLGLEHSHYGIIKREFLEGKLKDFDAIKKSLSLAFNIRCQNYDKPFEVKSLVGFLNTILKEWGFSSIVMGDRKRHKINGKYIDVSNFEVNNLFVWDYIRASQK